MTNEMPTEGSFARRPRFDATQEGDELVIYDRNQPQGWISAEHPMEIQQ